MNQYGALGQSWTYPYQKTVTTPGGGYSRDPWLAHLGLAVGSNGPFACYSDYRRDEDRFRPRGIPEAIRNLDRGITFLRQREGSPLPVYDFPQVGRVHGSGQHLDKFCRGPRWQGRAVESLGKAAAIDKLE